MDVQPFTIRVSDAELADLRARLAATRWPDSMADSGWEYGIDFDYLKGLVSYWQAGFDWRVREAALNAFPHFRATVDGLSVHFIHTRGRGPAPLPLVLTHGWPGSFVEMLPVISLLTDPVAHGGDPADAFDVVVPSLPGFGFSDRPSRPGVNLFRIADLWAELMAGLGYVRFGAQGGDFGAGVATALGLRHPDRLVGLHLNYIPGSYCPADDANPSPEEAQFLRDADEWYAAEDGYAHVQRTRPDTVAVGLTDSPAGLAAWVVEKFRAWGDCGGEVGRRFARDDLLTNLTIYWVTRTVRSAARLYAEVRKAPLRFRPGEFVRTPCGVARFPKEAPFPPRSWVERGYNVRRWTTMPAGGHFAALEEPGLLADDVRAFFRPMRAAGGS